LDVISATATAIRAAAGAPARRRRRAALAWALGSAFAGLVLFACYLRQSRTVPAGSDGASQALQAWDLLHGNPLLHGWWVTDVSFYTTELPQYALLELARGLTADVIHVAGAMTYTLLVLTAALLARGRVSGTEGVTRALTAAGIMLAPQLGPGTQTLVLSPDHAGTSVPILLVFLLIDWPGYLAGARPGGAGWHVPVLVCLGLASTALADAMTIFVAVIPLALVCAIRVWHGIWRDREPFTTCRREASLAVAAVLAVPAELGAAALIRAHGGWRVNGLHTALARAGQLAGNARLAGEGLLELFGADVFGATTGVGTALAAVHLAGLALAVAGFATAAGRFLRRDQLIEAVLVTGIVIDLAAYLAGVQAVDILSTREIVPVLPFAAVLAGRCLAPPCPARRGWLCAFLALYAAGLGYAAAQPAAAPQYADLASWLRAHHLAEGLSGYHQANIVTLETGGAVSLRPVAPGADGRLAAYAWNASSAWYEPAARTATFLVLADPGLATPGTPGASGVTTARAIATFGPPAASYRYKEYEILTWRRGVNLLASLHLPHPLSYRDYLCRFERIWSVHRQFDISP
jgi:hypothetical protein